MKKKRRFAAISKKSTDMSLNITSMADIFTILLVFLLKTFSSGMSTINPAVGISLPDGAQGQPLMDVLKVEVSGQGILVDSKLISKLQNFEFESQDLDSHGQSQSLRQEFARRAPASAGVQAERGLPILLLADQDTPYSTLKAVMNTAAISGYGDFKLVVVEDR